MSTAGFELYIPSDEEGSRWAKTTNRMKTLGLVGDEEAASIAGWHGETTLRGAELPQGFSTCVRVVRRAQVKFRIDSGGFAKTKAYLSMSPTLTPF